MDNDTNMTITCTIGLDSLTKLMIQAQHTYQSVTMQADWIFGQLCESWQKPKPQFTPYRASGYSWQDAMAGIQPTANQMPEPKWTVQRYFTTRGELQTTGYWQVVGQYPTYHDAKHSVGFVPGKDLIIPMEVK